MELSPIAKDIIVEFLIGKLDPKIIYLYGSFARKEGRSDSDVDLAFCGEHSMSTYELLMLANQLALKIKKDVGLVNLQAASAVFQAQVVSGGEVLYSPNEVLRANYEIRVYKEYAMLNRERKPILDRIREEGSIYMYLMWFAMKWRLLSAVYCV